jgi:hypothetical protein
MRRPDPGTRASRLALLSAAGLLACACGGGGGGASGDGGFEALFLGDLIPPMGVGMGAPGAFAGGGLGSDFDVEIRVAGPLSDVLGAGFRVQVPANVELTPPGFTDGDSFLRDLPSPNGFQFSALQAGDEVLVSATRLEGATYAGGVDVGAGEERILITLHFTVTSPTGGDLELIAPRELATCDDGTEDCNPAAVTWTGGALVAD